MHIVFVGIHVMLMVLSLILMPTAIGMALRGIRTSIRVATAGMVSTTVGFVFGVILLLSSPILSECVILTSYLAAVTTVYAVGFGWGLEPKARLLKKA